MKLNPGRTRRLFPKAFAIAGFSVWLLGAGLATPAPAGDRNVVRANYELAERLSLANIRKLVFDLNVEPSWIGASDAFWYRWRTSQGTEFFLVDCPRTKIEKVFDRDALMSALAGLFGKPCDPAQIETLVFPDGTRRVRFVVEGALVEFDRALGTLKKLPDTELAGEMSPLNAVLLKYVKDMTGGGTIRGDRLYSPGDRWGVFTRNHNLYVVDSRDPETKEFQLTSDGAEWHGFDNSMNADDGRQNADQMVFVRWFPDGNRFSITRMDRRKVRDMYLLQPLTRPYPTYPHYKNTLAGDANSDQYELWVFDCEKKTGTKIDIDKWTDQQLGGKATDGGIYPYPELERIYFVRTNRPWTKTDLAYADLKTGEVRTVIEEEQYPNVTPTSLQVKILNKGNEIIWWSDRDGWGHFYLYDGRGHPKNRITSGDFCCRSIIRADEATRTLYFTACGREPGHNPYYEHLYRVGFDGSNLKCLTPENANHLHELAGASIAFSPSGRYFVANHSRVDQAPRAIVRDTSGRKVLELEHPDISPA